MYRNCGDLIPQPGPLHHKPHDQENGQSNEEKEGQTGFAQAAEGGAVGNGRGADIARAGIPEGTGGQIFQHLGHGVVEGQGDHPFIHVEIGFEQSGQKGE